MSPKAAFALYASLAVAVSSSIGGYLSHLIDRGAWPWWTAILSAILSGAVWGLMCRHTDSLVFASLLYDVVATLTYTAVFLAGGERLSLPPIVGVLLALGGVALVGMK